jgi:nucleotide-sensitive chloride channel 1A
MEVLRTPPVAASFTPLAEHQSRTPESFFTGSPVLHYHSDRCKVIVLESDLTAAPALNALRGPVVNTNGGAQEVRGETTSEKEIVIDEVDVWVTSESVSPFSLTHLFLCMNV